MLGSMKSVSVTDTQQEGSYYVTIESQDLFSKCYPEITRVFTSEPKEQKKKSKGLFSLQYIHVCSFKL